MNNVVSFPQQRREALAAIDSQDATINQHRRFLESELQFFFYVAGNQCLTPEEAEHQAALFSERLLEHWRLCERLGAEG